MNIQMRSIFKATAMAAGVLAATMAGGASRAGVILQSQFQGGPGVNMTYSTGSGTASEGASAGAFTATPTSPAGAAFDAYCVSPEVQVGWGPDTIHVSGVSSLHSVGQDFFTHSNYADVGNRLEFLLWAHGGGGADAKSALALAIWHTMDKNFTYSGANAAVNALYAQYIQFTGYTQGSVYAAGAKLFVVDQAASPYQNLIGVSSVPEPASVISAFVGLGAAGLFAARRGRRQGA